MHVGLCAWVPVLVEGRVDRCRGAGVTDGVVLRTEHGSLKEQQLNFLGHLSRSLIVIVIVIVIVICYCYLQFNFSKYIVQWCYIHLHCYEAIFTIHLQKSRG